MIRYRYISAVGVSFAADIFVVGVISFELLKLANASKDDRFLLLLHV